jgi:hypothetical protein
MPLGRKLSKGNFIGMVASLKKYTAPNPTTKAVDQVSLNLAKDALMNMLLDYIDDDDITFAIWKAGLQAMLSNDLRKQAEAASKSRPI